MEFRTFIPEISKHFLCTLYIYIYIYIAQIAEGIADDPTKKPKNILKDLIEVIAKFHQVLRHGDTGTRNESRGHVEAPPKF
jgi:hypothetical protein